MSRSSKGRQLAKTLSRNSTILSKLLQQGARTPLSQTFSSSASRSADDDDGQADKDARTTRFFSFFESPPKGTTAVGSKPHRPSLVRPPGQGPSLVQLAQNALQDTAQMAAGQGKTHKQRVDNQKFDAALAELDRAAVTADADSEQMMDPYHFHIYSHKHNTHVTVTKPNRDTILSLSCGNLGFRKSQRKNYDSAYQLGAYVIDKLQQKGWHRRISALEVVLAGFGAGREAVIKVILGNEGRLLRSKITKVSDSTKLKFGGTRSQRPRRLG